MKKLLVFVFATGLAMCSFAQEDPVIMTVNGKSIKKSEFLQVYLKNNNDPKYDEQSLDEYMELFKKLRLKVEEAKSLGYDTLPRIVNELKGYRKQLSTPYMIDTVKSAELIKEGYDRMKFEIRAKHILIRLAENASPEDTLKAYNTIMGLRKRVLDGEDFSKVASGKGGSQDPSVMKNGGDLGYFSAFQMVYPFETAAYSTKVGDVSMPVRTKFGYHIIQVLDKRDARGKILTAHIMIMHDKSAENMKVDPAKVKIDEVYAKLQAGEEFRDLAIKYSEDQSTRQKGGRLPFFGTGTRQRMVPEFEDAAFALKNDNDFSEPFETQYGWHIVQRLKLEGLQPLEELRRELQNKINRDSRSLQTQNSFINNLKAQYEFKSHKDKVWNDVLKAVDTSIFAGRYQVPNLKKDPPLFSFVNQDVKISDFLKFLTEGQRKIRTEDMNTYLNRKYEFFEEQTIRNYEDSQLENKYPKFKALMKEFNDGVLFYEVMNEFVWQKANKDTVGLKKFYEANKNKFMWTDRLDATIVECDNKKVAKTAYKLMKKNSISMDSITKVLNEDSKLNARVSKGKYELSKNNIVKDRDLSVGINKPFENEGKYVVVDVKEKLPAAPKELKEARGEISLAYQAHLEEKWLEELAKKYPITVNKEVLHSLGK